MDTSISTAVESPATVNYPVNTENLDSKLFKPHVPRGTLDREHTEEDGRSGGLSVLQQHVSFFDRNSDGIIYPWETFAGFRALGFNLLWSFGAAIVINCAFSYPTSDSWIPSIFFPIMIRNIHRAKHGSDSEVYDTEGRFVPEKFAELFSKFDKESKGSLNFQQLYRMTEVNRNVMDPFGWFASKLEWGLTYLLLKDRNGEVSKEDLFGVYDGTIFHRVEERRSASSGKKFK